MQNRNPAHARAPTDTLQTESTSTSGPAQDGMDCRNFLSCMAWAGTGLLWAISGGVPTSKLFAATATDSGVTKVNYIARHSHLTIVDSSLMKA